MRGIFTALLAATVLTVPARGQSQPPAPIEISFEARHLAEGESVRVQLTATPVILGRGGKDQEPRRTWVEAPEKILLILGQDRAWRLDAVGPGVWARPVVVVEGQRAAKLELIPTTDVRGVVVAERGERMPVEVTVRFETPEGVPAEERIGETIVRCPVQPDGALVCPVPVSRLDLRVRAAEFVSHFFWNVRLKAGEPHDLGPIKLRRGASIVGRVVPFPEAGPVALALAPYSADQGRGREEEKLRRMTLKERPNEHGFFHFDGIQPGSYKVIARQGEKARAQYFPVSVLENAESEIRDPLVLEPPVRLVVAIDPRQDFFEKPWRLRLLQLGDTPGSAGAVAEGRVDETGSFRSDPVDPGGYVLLVRDSTGNQVAMRELTLDRQTGEVRVEIPYVWVSGSVRLGEEPLIADVIFGGRFGAEKVTLHSDEEGHFEGALPREGDWPVHVASSAPSIARDFLAISVEAPSGSLAAEVELILPNTAVTGDVVDAEGRPFEGALVRLQEVETNLLTSAQTDASGKFRFHGAAEGTVILEASARIGSGEQAASQNVTVKIEEDRETDSVRLVLHPLRTLTGRVFSASGNVPGAAVEVRLIQDDGRWIALPGITKTRVDGTFAVQIPAQARGGLLAVLVPGYALRLVPLNEIPKEPLTLAVETSAGTVRINLPEPVRLRDPYQPKPQLFVDGRAISFFTIDRWIKINQELTTGPSLTVRQLPPANYTACWMPMSLTSNLLTLTPSGDCKSGFLAPGTELVLDLEPEGSSPEGA